MKKAVGHLIPYMEKEKREIEEKNGNVAGEAAREVLFFLYYLQKMFFLYLDKVTFNIIIVL